MVPKQQHSCLCVLVLLIAASGGYNLPYQHLLLDNHTQKVAHCALRRLMASTARTQLYLLLRALMPLESPHPATLRVNFQSTSAYLKTQTPKDAFARSRSRRAPVAMAVLQLLLTATQVASSRCPAALATIKLGCLTRTKP